MAQPTDSPQSLPPSPDEQQPSRDQPPASEKQKAVNNTSGPAAFNTTTFAAPDDAHSASLSSPAPASLSLSSPTPPAVPSLVSNLSSAADVVSNGLHGGQNGEVTDYHNGDVPLSSPSSMSNPPPPPHGPPRHTVSYPSPTSYPSPGMPGAQYAYAAAAVHGPDAYRAGPAGMNSAMPLPSMRSIDPMQHPQAQALQMGAPLAGPMGHGGPPMAYYPHPYAIHSDPNALRYPLPADPRGLTAGRHKKEIKRRTKTGCLTCRKRRIKCDETHPTCNNCKKSKRDCLGYDPIFKQASTPSSVQSTTSQPSAPTTLTSTPTVPSLPGGPYVSQQPVVPSTYPPHTVPSNAPFDSSQPGNSAHAKHEGGYDYSGAIDPALDTVASPVSSGIQPQLQSDKPQDGTKVGDQSVAEATPRARMKIDELVDLGGSAPPRFLGNKNMGEIIKIYYEVYVPGLTTFFETQWFNFREHSVTILRDNHSITNLFAQFLESLQSVKTTDPADMGYSGHLETRLVWALTCLLRSAVPPNVNNAHRPLGDTPYDDDPIEARNRLLVFEALLSGESLAVNPLMRPLPPNSPDTIRRKELSFWFQLAEFVTQRSGEDRQNSLAQMRALLDGRENRDLLYSLAVLREVSPLFPAGCENDAPQHLDETDERNRLIVATRFVQAEAVTTNGTTNVVRRFSELAIKAFVYPGVNVARGPSS